MSDTMLQDYITVHFVHGAITKPGKKAEKTRLGGILGGHVEIQIDMFFYGFQYRNRNRIHIFSRKKTEKFNAKFAKKTYEYWSNETHQEKVTSIQIPVTNDQKTRILSIYNEYLKDIPYDYALFGKRCTSSACLILQEVGVIPKQSFIYTMINTFYPRLWRKTLIQYARKNNFSISIKKGSTLKFWE